MPASPTVRNASENRNHVSWWGVLGGDGTHQGLKALVSSLGFLRQASAAGDERAAREQRLCLQICQR